ncbi:hypothetical protein PMAYCL1PPCAC_31505, partial [Pristionchus mayeri]
YSGPCTLIGAQFCHRALALYVVLFAHANYLLLFSFSYRYWMLGKSSLTNAGPPQIRGRMWIIALVSMTPTLVTMVASDSAAVFDHCPRGTICSAVHLAEPGGVMTSATKM